LEVDPVVHELVLSSILNFLIAGEYEWLDSKNEISNVDGKTNADEMVHLEEETEGTLLHLSSL